MLNYVALIPSEKCIWKIAVLLFEDVTPYYLQGETSVHQITIKIQGVRKCFIFRKLNYLSIYLSISIYLKVSNYFYLSIFWFLSIFIYPYLYIYLPTWLSIYEYFSVLLSFYLSIYPTICLSIFLSIYLSICTSIHLYIYLFIQSLEPRILIALEFFKPIFSGIYIESDTREPNLYNIQYIYFVFIYNIYNIVNDKNIHIHINLQYIYVQVKVAVSFNFPFGKSFKYIFADSNLFYFGNIY